MVNGWAGDLYSCVCLCAMLVILASLAGIVREEERRIGREGEREREEGRDGGREREGERGGERGERERERARARERDSRYMYVDNLSWFTHRSSLCINTG